MNNFILSLLFIAFNSQAAEVDNFSSRNAILKDATAIINEHSNQLFYELIERENNKNHGCNEKSLYKTLRKEFNNHYVGDFSKFIVNTKEIERILIPTAKSIYQDFTPQESIILGYLSHRKDPIASTINVNGHLIGTDKFEHFIGTGFKYFENYYLNKNTIESTIAIGKHDETGLLGAKTTGVISYGDMTAEFNGMRFWNHILSKNNDVLGIELGPYLKCTDKKWTIVKEIDFSKYVDDAWDEGLNCSTFRTESMAQKVKKRIEMLEDVTKSKLGCPISLESISDELAKYRNFSHMIINLKGNIKEND